jgi:hypothetical protein
MATDWFIVKIQLSEFPRNESVLAYNEDKSIFIERAASEEDVLLLDEVRKLYAMAYVDEDGVLIIDLDQEVEGVEW